MPRLPEDSVPLVSPEALAWLDRQHEALVRDAFNDVTKPVSAEAISVAAHAGDKEYGAMSGAALEKDMREAYRLDRAVTPPPLPSQWRPTLRDRMQEVQERQQVKAVTRKIEAVSDQVRAWRENHPRVVVGEPERIDLQQEIVRANLLPEEFPLPEVTKQYRPTKARPPEIPAAAMKDRTQEMNAQDWVDEAQVAQEMGRRARFIREEVPYVELNDRDMVRLPPPLSAKQNERRITIAEQMEIDRANIEKSAQIKEANRALLEKQREAAATKAREAERAYREANEIRAMATGAANLEAYKRAVAEREGERRYNEWRAAKAARIRDTGAGPALMAAEQARRAANAEYEAILAEHARKQAAVDRFFDTQN